MSLILPLLDSVLQNDSYQNCVTIFHQITFFMFLFVSLSPIFKSYYPLLLAVVTNMLANFWFFFVFNWNLSYVFALISYVLLLKTVLLYHGVQNSLTVLILVTVLYVSNSKGDHNFSSYVFYPFSVNFLSVVSSLSTPLLYLTPPLALVPLILRKPRKVHNHFL